MPWRTGWKKHFAYALAVAFASVYLEGVASLPVHSGERTLIDTSWALVRENG